VRAQVNRHQWSGVLALLLCAAIWGMSFVAQKSGMRYVAPLAFNTFRFTFGFLSMIPLLIVRSGRTKPSDWKKTCGFSIASGALLFAAITFEQLGVNLSASVGRSGFITALYIILVPLIGIFFGHRPHARVFIAALLSLAGLALLTIDPAKGWSSLGMGDLLLFLGAICFAVQMIVVDRSPINPIHLSIGQMLVGAILSWIAMVALNDVPSWTAFTHAGWAMAYSGVISTGIAYALQIFGQRVIPPAPASILMSLESLFSAIFGALILGDRMTVPAMIGCAFMLCGTIVSQIPGRTEKRKEEYVEHEQ
jgi:drug/metabolite transporter (DMT)-like permease